MNLVAHHTSPKDARTAIDLRARRVDHNSTPNAMITLQALVERMPAAFGTMTPDVLTAVGTTTGSPGHVGEPSTGGRR